ncbi:unnamed protein product [Oppiella nova]|uniref:UDP-glycosyltransferase n=1 Tax=Oppiella nova TaxID=334625 RepID=A0A7R9QAX5_9ACAR|nr:unnamed protein product [Oppiella nova]CAG2161564.1 unnamed protein product [Oppiella nova]
MAHRKLTVLFAPMQFVGPVNSSIGMAEVLRDIGRHHCVFAVKSDWKSRLESIGFVVKLIGEEVARDVVVTDSADTNVAQAEKWGVFRNVDPLEQLINNGKAMDNLTDFVETDGYLKTIISDVKPDVIISDHMTVYPSMETSGIPWIFFWSANPLSLDYGYPDERLPPSILGLPTNTETEVKEKYRQRINAAKSESWYRYRDQLVSMGGTAPKEFLMWTPSPFANLYMTPKELDYTDVRPLPDNFYAFDCFKRSGNDDNFEIPETLKNRAHEEIGCDFVQI